MIIMYGFYSFCIILSALINVMYPRMVLNDDITRATMIRLLSFAGAGILAQLLFGEVYIGLSIALLVVFLMTWISYVRRRIKSKLPPTIPVGSTGHAYVTMAPEMMGIALVTFQGETIKIFARNGSGRILESGDRLKVLAIQGEIAIVVPSFVTIDIEK